MKLINPLCWGTLVLSLLCTSIGANIPQNDVNEEIENSGVEVDQNLPELLTLKTFKSSIKSQNLSLIEFYSPYCSHCMAFAPTWEKTFHEFQKDFENFPVQMFQVNCIESGDLCNDEKILAYPSLKLYGPNGFISNFPNSLKRNQENIIQFMKEQSLDINDPNNFKIESKSELITTESMIKLLGEKEKQPWLISFWPSNDLNNLDDLNWHIFEKSDYYEEALDFQRIWSIISNSITNSFKNIKIGHFNCFKNKKICKELGISDDFKPKVKLFLPNLLNSKIISYPNDDEELKVKNVLQFLKHSLQISNFEKIDSVQLLDNGLKTKLKSLTSLPSISENTFIYLYDEKLTVEEDFQILPHLIQEFIKYPNTNFYLSNDTNILKIVELQQKNKLLALNKINNKIEFPIINDDKYVINTMSTLPTLISFKEFSLDFKIFQSFGPSDIRDERLVKNFIKENSSPFISELKNYENFNDKNQFAILLIDSNDKDLKPIDNFILGAHKYEELKSNFTYSKLLKDREIKYSKAKEFKQNDDYKKMIKTLKQEIQQLKLTNTNYVYIDISKNQNLLETIGIKVNNEDYKPGKVIIINNGFYYTTTLDNTPITSNPNEISSSLSIINKIIKSPTSLKKNLIKSPFSIKFRILDNIHQFGIWGYIIIMILIVIFMKAYKIRIGNGNGNYLPLFEEKKD